MLSIIYKYYTLEYKYTSAAVSRTIIIITSIRHTLAYSKKKKIHNNTYT